MQRVVIPLFVAALLTSSPAGAATLRTLTTLHSSNVRLSDLFDDAGPNAARVLGPGPAPGSRIVVEAPQLAAIARQFDVDWRPASPADRAVLDRPGRLLPRKDVMAALRTALTNAGAPTDADIELPGYSPPLVAEQAHPQTVVDQLDYDSSSGHFSGLLEVVGTDMPGVTMRLTGTLEAMADLPVPTHLLPAGSVIGPDDLQIARVHAELARGEVVQTAAQAIGLAVRHQVNAGQPLPLAALTRPLAVRNGARVTMELQEAGLSLLAEGQAMGSGSIGDRIQVLNPNSHAVVEADVIAPGRVRVAPGSVPLHQPSGGMVQFSSVVADAIPQ